MRKTILVPLLQISICWCNAKDPLPYCAPETSSGFTKGIRQTGRGCLRLHSAIGRLLDRYARKKQTRLGCHSVHCIAALQPLWRALPTACTFPGWASEHSLHNLQVFLIEGLYASLWLRLGLPRMSGPWNHSCTSSLLTDKWFKFPCRPHSAGCPQSVSR